MSDINIQSKIPEEWIEGTDNPEVNSVQNEFARMIRDINAKRTG